MDPSHDKLFFGMTRRNSGAFFVVRILIAQCGGMPQWVILMLLFFSMLLIFK
ncbi:hypothetical protein [Pandoraea anapnoica]|uniref:hypothetical protein n=1 Tax=Pandoraea anapnoica TaxID=2508301 RepID=UPI001582BBBB|nr:hypothetical protein [Pandoraea anapnoica]